MRATKTIELLVPVSYTPCGAGLARKRASWREGWPEMAGVHRGARSDGRENRLKKTSLLHFFADLVIIAGWLHPIPFRTRP